MNPQDEAAALAYAEAARFGCKMGCDEFEVWHRDPDVRRRIYSAAKLCEDNVNTAADLVQDAWLEICQLPPDSSRKAILDAAHRAIRRPYECHWKRKKKLNTLLGSLLGEDVLSRL